MFAIVSVAGDEPWCMSRPPSNKDDINISSSFGSLQAVAVGNGITVAVGVSTILVTTDHKTWVRHRFNEHSNVSDRYFVDVLWDGNKFVVLTISGKIFVSDANAGNWTQRSEILIAEPAPNKAHFRKLRFNRGLYVALSDSESTNVYLSYGDDALQWKTDRVEGYSHYGSLVQMLWARDRYYIASGASIIEPRLLSYKNIRVNVEFLPTAPTGVTFDGSRFYRVVHRTTDISRSVDGKSWDKLLSLKVLPAGSRLNSIPMRTMRHVNGKYLIGGGCGIFVSSDNGVDWEIDVTGSAAFIEDIIWAGNEYLAVGWAYSHGAIFKSMDGKKWIPLYERNGSIAIK